MTDPVAAAPPPDAPTPPQSQPSLGFRARLARLLVAWGGLFLASPGVVGRDGSALGITLAVALWSATASRPGRAAPLAEVLAGGLGWSALMGWAAYVWPPLLVWIGVGHGLYAAAAGSLLRRLVRGVPLWVATPLAWVGVETVRALVPPPFGLESWQLGHALHALPALAGSARVWGLGGLGLVVGAAAGGLAGLARGGPGLARGGWRPAGRREALAGFAPTVGFTPLAFAPLALAALLAAVTAPPAAAPGPRVLLVQPGFEQARKQYGDPFENHRDGEALTRAGLEAEAGRVDLVVWGETMVPTRLYDASVDRALAEGWTPPPRFAAITPQRIASARRAEERLVDDMLAGWGPHAPAFLAGIETFEVRGGDLRRGNAAVLWDPGGGRSRPALKVHLVPGAETLFGLERMDFVRRFVLEIAGYVPNLSAGERTEVLTLESSGAEPGPWRMGVGICFDNAFLDVFTSPLRRGPVDFHVVLSNEAWYRSSWEVDQMMAYSRVAALATGRAVVRATNSGISAVVGPDGREVTRLWGSGADGERTDRMARGVLSAVVPVPTAGAEAPRTLFVRTEAAWTGLLLLAPLVALLARRRKAA